MSSGKWRPFCLALNVLRRIDSVCIHVNITDINFTEGLELAACIVLYVITDDKIVCIETPPFQSEYKQKKKEENAYQGPMLVHHYQTRHWGTLLLWETLFDVLYIPCRWQADWPPSSIGPRHLDI